MGPEARLAHGAEQALQRLVAEEVDAFLGQVELHLLRGRLRLAAGPEHRLIALGHLRDLGRLSHVQVAFVDQPLHDAVEQLAQVVLGLAIPLGIAGGLAAERLQHVLGELARVHERLENGLAQ